MKTEFGWSTLNMSLAVSVNLVPYGLTAPFAAALTDRFGLRQMTATALVLIAAAAAATTLVQQSWQLLLTWGLLIGLGTGSVALVFAATVADRWFVARRGLVLGILTAGVVRDRLGSSTSAWIGGGALCGIAAVVSISIRRGEPVLTGRPDAYALSRCR